MNLDKYGLPTDVLYEAGSIPARITAVHRERYELVCERGQAVGKLKSSTYFADTLEDFPTTGDFVLVNYKPSGESQIVRTLPRKSFFSRRDPDKGRGEQVIAANFDYVFIMQSLNQDFNPKRLERYVTLAWQSGAIPVVILTKADLVDDCAEQLEAVEGVAFGVDIHVVSAVAGTGLDAITAYLQPGKTAVFLGSSGVGKSSLVNALAGQEIMAVAEIREDDAKGRHTTTHRQLIMLDNGAMIIDTPGLRELGMWDVSSGLGEAFLDVERYFADCRFSDCQHRTEPGCAVKAALETGELSSERWKSYLHLKREAKFTDDKAAYFKTQQQLAKERARWSKLRKKNDVL